MSFCIVGDDGSTSPFLRSLDSDLSAIVKGGSGPCFVFFFSFVRKWEMVWCVQNKTVVISWSTFDADFVEDASGRLSFRSEMFAATKEKSCRLRIDESST